MPGPLIVLKFGGSVISSERSLADAVHEIYRWRRDGYSVLAVVSAIAGLTDALLARCDSIEPRSGPAARAATVALGEAESAALLGVRLDRAGLAACVLSPGAIALRAVGSAIDASPISVDTGVLARALDVQGVVVVPGYAALDDLGRTVLLGRGGSDLTALFLASQLNAERCRLVKDVDALYEYDPAIPRDGAAPRRYHTATFADALATDGSIIQHKAVRFAESVRLAFELGSLNGVEPTRVGVSRSLLSDQPEIRPPLSVALLGHGTVGSGVRHLLDRHTARFRLAGIAVRDTRRHPGIPSEWLWSDPIALASSGADVVVEAMGGIEPAYEAIRAALRAGSDVVTANKAVLAEHGQSLLALADSLGRRLLYSASVGGALPAIERARATAPVRLRGVLNGTANFVLNECAGDADFSTAVASAQALGLAEADPSRDLDGRDALDKLKVLALTLGFDMDLARGIHSLEPITSGADGGLRHVATLDETGLSVRLEHVTPDDPLFDLPGEWNALQLIRADGTSEIIRGRGAGRWPTAESVFADLLQLSRETSVQREAVSAEHEEAPYV